MAEAPVLGAAEARALLRECAAVVKPGETLVIRADGSWTPADTDGVYRHVAALGLPFRVALLPGEEFAVARAQLRDPLGDEVTVTVLDGLVRMTHVRSGVTAEAETREQAAGALSLALAKAGVICARDAREAPEGVPPAVAEASLRARVAGMVSEMMPGMLARELERRASQAPLGTVRGGDVRLG